MNSVTFWSEFENSAARLADSFRRGEQQPVFHEIDRLLQANGFPFCFDLTEEGNSVALILSPEGVRQEAAQIDALLGCAPSLPDWRLYGGRQAKDLHDVRAIVKNLYLIDPQEVRFQIDQIQSPVIRMFLPG